MTQVRKAVLQSFLSANITRVLNLALIVIIARTLSPAELGVYAIAAASILIVSEIKTFGVAGILVRKKEISESDVRSALGVTVLISWGLGFLVAVLAELIEGFYGVEDIANLLYIQVIAFFLSPYSSIGGALFQRNFLFKQITIINLVSQSMKFVVTIALLEFGFSYFSIAIGLLTSVIISLILTVYQKPPLMQFKPQFSNLRPFLAFGTFATFGNLFRRISITLPDLIIGKMGTLSQVAYFSRAIGLLDFITVTLVQGINPVTTPYLSKVNRESRKYVEEAYNRVTALTGCLLLPALAVGTAASYPLIVFMFGIKWVESAALASILGIWMAFRSIHMFLPSVLLTLEREKTFFYKELLVTLLSGVAIYLGIQQGIREATIAFAIVGFLDFAISTLVLRFICGFSFRRFLVQNYTNGLISVLLYLCTYLVDVLFPFETSSFWLIVPVLLVVNTAVWFASIALFSHPLFFELKNLFIKFKSKN